MGRAVVIGGGVVGACCAIHLRDRGLRVTLLEQGPALGGQTTSAGAGFVAYWSTALEASMAAYGADFYEGVQDEAGRDLGVRRSGLLLPALSEAGIDLLKGLWEYQRTFADDVEWLTAEATESIAPLLARGSVRAAVFQSRALRVPTGPIMEALTDRLRSAGVEVRLRTVALGSELNGRRVCGVRTANGAVSADIVVNAAGAWARALAARDGVDVHAVPLLESRFVTEPIEALADDHPMMLFFERALLYMRPEGGGLLVGAVESALEPESRPPVSDPPPVSRLSLHAADAHERLARDAADVVPVLRDLRVRSQSSGMPTFTPDGRHILGEAPELEGYFVAAGCNESGVTHAPGLGRLLAELITTGSTGMDIAPYCVERFGGLGDAEVAEAAAATYLKRLALSGDAA